MFSLKNESKTIKITLLLSCIVLFGLTIFTIFYYGNGLLLGNYYKPDNDDVKFIRSALTLVKTGVYVFHKPPAPTVFMMPGLPFTLAFLMKLFGEHGGLTALRIVQALVQVLSLLLTFYIARKLFNSKVAIIAVIIDVFYIAEIWMPTLALTETFFKFFVLCLIFISIYALERNQYKYYMLGGVFLALATLFRPTIATYPILILIMWIIKKVKFKDAVKYTLIVAVVFSAIMSPWWIRNYEVFHRFIPFTLADGNPMRQGTFIDYNAKVKDTEGIDYSDYNYLNPNLTEIQKNDMEVAFSKYRLSRLFPKEPLRFIYWYTIEKAWIQIRTPFYWKEILGVSFDASKAYHSILLLLGLVGIILYFKNKKRNELALLPFMALIYFIVVYLPFYTMSRYYYPIMPCMMIFAGYAVLKIYEELKIRHVKNIAGSRE